MSLGKSRQCAECCLELLAIEIVHYYAKQKITPPAAALGAIGSRVGGQLVERYTANRARLTEHLEVIKFICKDFWGELFEKQVDNLRTNHRGTFVLKDNNFRWLTRLSLNQGESSGANTAELAKDYLHLPCAIIRGALLHLGVECTVAAEATALQGGGHACEFTVTIKPRA